jgi:hypothetical protein
MAIAPGRARFAGQEFGFDEEERGDEHVVEIVEDVIEQGAVETAGVGLHVSPARQDAVETVHEDGGRHPDDGEFPFVREDGPHGEESPHRACGSEKVDAPRESFAEEERQSLHGMAPRLCHFADDILPHRYPMPTKRFKPIAR